MEIPRDPEQEGADVQPEMRLLISKFVEDFIQGDARVEEFFESLCVGKMPEALNFISGWSADEKSFFSRAMCAKISDALTGAGSLEVSVENAVMLLKQLNLLPDQLRMAYAKHSLESIQEDADTSMYRQEVLAQIELLRSARLCSEREIQSLITVLTLRKFFENNELDDPDPTDIEPVNE